jgi:acyl carrier protein
MVPSRFEFLPVLPLNRSGKIDRRALESGKLGLRSAGIVHEPPRTDTERRVAEIFQVVLAIESLGTNENQFDLGANSLLATMIVTRLMVAFEADLPLTLVFDLPTVSGLATLLSRRPTET